MMELPESNTLAHQINETITDKVILNVTANKSPHKFAWFTGNPENYPDLLTGKKIRSSESYGGMVEIMADDVRLVFSGGTNLRYFHSGEKLPAKHQLHIAFEDDSSLICSVQMYGSLWALKEGQTEKYNECARSKVSPLSDEFNESYFESLFTKPDLKLSVKAFLATNQRIPGLGNGVLQDILFNARIHPKRKMGSLSDAEFGSLYRSVKSTLADMTAKCGRDTEKDLFGRSGGYPTILSGKTLGAPCPVCGETIVRETYLGGKIYYCPRCQKPEK